MVIRKLIRHGLNTARKLVVAPRRALDKRRARRVDSSSLKTVCFCLGPYRNLTSLTAGVLALHPHCQVLNHGGQRIFGDRDLDFLADYAPARYEFFLKYALLLAESGGSGDWGGSIVHSHAFEPKHRLGALFQQFYSGRHHKAEPTCLFWKESLRTANHIRQYQPPLKTILANHPALRFLIPVRHPLDCASSCLKTGHARLFAELARNSRPSVEEVMNAILREYAWYLELLAPFPDRRFFLFESEFDAVTVKRLAAFLQVEPLEEWCRLALEAFHIDRSYNHPPALVEQYRSAVAREFATAPDFAAKLLRFVTPPPGEPSAAHRRSGGDGRAVESKS